MISVRLKVKVGLDQSTAILTLVSVVDLPVLTTPSAEMLEFISTLLEVSQQKLSEYEGRQGYGCNNNPLEVFGFLAFGLYLLNLAMGMGKRKKRSPDDDICNPDFNPINRPDLISGALAFYSMFEGFINANYESDGEMLAV